MCMICLPSTSIRNNAKDLEPHSSVDMSGPPNTWPRVQSPSTTSKLFNLFLNCDEKRTKINMKRLELANLKTQCLGFVPSSTSPAYLSNEYKKL